MTVNDRPEFLIGLKAEEAFSNFFENVITSTTAQDIKEHWDVEIDLGSKIRIDVKSLKKENRYDVIYNETFHWVEIKNVLGKSGWLYGDADMFAFELEDYWIIVEKQQLQGFIANKCKNKKIGSTKSIYELYRRKNRKDVVVKVKTIDLMYLSGFKIKK